MGKGVCIIRGGFLAACLAGVWLPSVWALDLGRDWEIVISDRDADGVQGEIGRLAEDFARRLRESSGLALPVRAASQAMHSSHAIYIGGPFAEKAGVLPADMRGWSNGIAEKGGNLYFFGRDCSGRKWQPGETPDPKKMVLPSVRALTRFMYRFMGVRFVMPGPNGLAVPKREKVSVPDGYADREDPDFDFMAGSTFFGLPAIGRGQYACGHYHSYGGHTYPAAVPKALYAKEHPEYFAQSREGKRVLDLSDGQTALCISNPAVEELIVAELLKRYDAGAEVCQLGQHDGSNHCWCETCRAMYGTGDDWCEKTWLFHKHIAERIEKLRPGKIVHILCYDMTRTPPKTFVKFPSNVMVELCGYTEETFAEWKRYDVPHGFTVYLYLWGNYPPPGFTAKRSFAGLSSLVRRLRDNRVHGIFRCGFGELPGMEGAQYYVFDRMLEDRHAQIEPTLKEFCDAAFGLAAGEPMKRFYETLDARLRMFDAMSMGHFEADGPNVSKYLQAVPSRTLDLLAYFYTPETLNAMEGCLRRAEAAAKTEQERIRLQRVRVEFDYARNLGRIAVLFAGYKAAPSKESFLPLARELQWRKTFLGRVFDGKGNVRRLKDWPDAPLFGASPLGVVRTNGRLGAVIGDPLNWDVDTMLAEGNYPGAPGEVERWKAYNASRRPKAMKRFRPYPNDLKAKLEVRPDGSGFTIATEPGVKDTRIIACEAPESGRMKPNTRYRVSWFARYDGITEPPGKAGGFCVLIQCGPGQAFYEPNMTSGLTGCSDWRHMSKTFTTRENVWDGCEVIFRIYDSQGRLEIEDVTIEELTEKGAERE